MNSVFTAFLNKSIICTAVLSPTFFAQDATEESVFILVSISSSWINSPASDIPANLLANPYVAVVCSGSFPPLTLPWVIFLGLAALAKLLPFESVPLVFLELNPLSYSLSPNATNATSYIELNIWLMYGTFPAPIAVPLKFLSAKTPGGKISLKSPSFLPFVVNLKGVPAFG